MLAPFKQRDRQLQVNEVHRVLGELGVAAPDLLLDLASKVLALVNEPYEPWPAAVPEQPDKLAHPAVQIYGRHQDQLTGCVIFRQVCVEVERSALIGAEFEIHQDQIVV